MTANQEVRPVPVYDEVVDPEAGDVAHRKAVQVEQHSAGAYVERRGTVALSHPAFWSPQILHWRLEYGVHGAIRSLCSDGNKAQIVKILPCGPSTRIRSCRKSCGQGS